jgi:hypothetical protein
MEQYMDRSQDKRSLFQAGHSYGNIVLNFQNASNREFGAYARAFHTAGQALFEQMFDKSGYNDLEGCPIIFLYRHALELYLKAIALHGEVIMQMNGKTLLTNRKILQNHNLHPFFPLLKRTFDAVGWTWDLDIEGLRTFEEVEELLRDFETVDIRSYAFRYPVDTKGNPSVPHHFMVHMPTFCKRMDALLESLEAALMGLEVTEDSMLEAAYYAQDGVEKFDDALDFLNREQYKLWVYLDSGLVVVPYSFNTKARNTRM